MTPAILLLAGLAQATPNFPDAVATWAESSCSPSCALCHVGAPGNGTANTDLALALKDRGLVPRDETKLFDALDQLEVDGVDSDDDGVTDAEELLAGDNPNPGGGALCEGPIPIYGCFDQGRASASLVGLLIAIGAIRRSERHKVSSA